MTTYAESKGQPPFDWNTFLSKALTAELPKEEWDAMEAFSADWITCATGNQCAIIPRDGIGMPENVVAAKLGGNDGFHGRILARDVKGAFHYLRLIEAHSAYLIEIEVEKHRVAMEQGLAALAART